MYIPPYFCQGHPVQTVLFSPACCSTAFSLPPAVAAVPTAAPCDAVHSQPRKEYSVNSRDVVVVHSILLMLLFHIRKITSVIHRVYERLEAMSIYQLETLEKIVASLLAVSCREGVGFAYPILYLWLMKKLG